MRSRRALVTVVAVVVLAVEAVGAATAAPPAAAATAATVTGTVVQSAGEGVAGVTVAATDTSSGTVSATVVTDSSGHYTLTLATGTYDLAFTPSTSSGLTGTVLKAVAVTADTDLGLLVLPASPGAPPPRVMFSGHARGFGTVMLRSANGAGTGSQVFADGSFSIGVEPGTYEVMLDNFSGGTIDLQQDTTVDYSLPAVSHLSVNVVDTNGQPVQALVTVTAPAGTTGLAAPGAAGFALAGQPIEEWFGAPTTLASGSTDSSGTAILPSYLFTNPVQATVTVTQYAFAVPPAVTAIGTATLQISGDASVTVIVAPPSPPASPVRFAGRAAGFHTVGLATLANGTLTTVATANVAADGTFSTTVAPGSYVVELDDFAGGLVAVDSDTTVDYSLASASTLTLHVVDPDGQPVAGALVGVTLAPGSVSLAFAGSGLPRLRALHPADPYATSISMGQATTDANGVALVPSYPFTSPVGVQLLVVASPWGLVQQTASVATNSSVTIALPTPPPTPPPPSDQPVTFSGNALGFHSVTLLNTLNPAVGETAITPAPDGSFSARVDPARYMILLDSRSGFDGFSATTDINTDTVVNYSLGQVSKLGVRVVDADGAPVAGAGITESAPSFSSTGTPGTPPLAFAGGSAFGLFDLNQLSAIFDHGPVPITLGTATTDASGLATLPSYRFTSPAPFTLDVTAPGLPAQHLTVPVNGTQTVTVVLAQLQGTLTNAAGQPLVGQNVELSPVVAGTSLRTVSGAPRAAATTAAGSVSTAAGGSYAVNVAPGSYRLRVFGGATDASVPSLYDIAVPSVDLSSPRTIPLALPVVRVNVAVTGPAGPVAGADVSIPCAATSPIPLFPGGTAQGQACGDATTDAAGHATVAMLPASGVSLVVTPPAGSGLDPATVTPLDITGNLIVPVGVAPTGGTTFTSRYAPNEYGPLFAVSRYLNQPDLTVVQHTAAMFLAFLAGLSQSQGRTPLSIGSNPGIGPLVVTSGYAPSDAGAVTQAAAWLASDPPTLQHLGVMFLAYLIAVSHH